MVSYKVWFRGNENDTPHVWSCKTMNEYVASYFEGVDTFDHVRRKELIPFRVLRCEPGKRDKDVTGDVRFKLLSFTAYATETFARREVKSIPPRKRRKLIALEGENRTWRQRMYRRFLADDHKADVCEEFTRALAAATVMV